MASFLIEVTLPAMGATVNELTVISLKAQPGETVRKGQKIAELESDKSVFDFESPADGVLRAVLVAAGDVRPSGSPFLRLETEDESLRHLAAGAAPALAAVPATAPAAAAALIWTPRAAKLAQEAGLDPATLTGIEATGPGGRVSGDDVARYLAARKS
jgi:pyruvate/2-oxoglutarate dehydrogenase complex dihydrolipoamide acyltransferase (E2) component